VDSSAQFEWYKNEHNKDKDITYDYFEHYNNINDVKLILPINYFQYYQFEEYWKLNYNNICPVVDKYFSPSIAVKDIMNAMEQKYELDYENICVLFYRGNDKNRETHICEYAEYLRYAREVLSRNPKVQFLIQSDETGFIDFMKNQFPANSFYFKDEIRHMEKCDDTVDLKMKSTNFEFTQKYLAITIIMSKCKYVICGSGNCSIWILLYRKTHKNVVQYLNGIWYNYLS